MQSFCSTTVLSNSVKSSSLQLRVSKCWRFKKKKRSFYYAALIFAAPDAAPHKRMQPVEECLQQNMLVMPLLPYLTLSPSKYSINGVRHWIWRFVKSHLYLSWIKNGIVGSQSSYSKHFSETSMAELPNTTSVSGEVVFSALGVFVIPDILVNAQSFSLNGAEGKV